MERVLNDAPREFEDLENLPIKTVNGTVVTMRDVAHVRDGSPPQTNIVHQDGTHAVLMTVLKSGSASTLDIIAGVKAILPQIKAGLPPSLRVELVGDQSVFVTSAVVGVVREGLIAAGLTGLLILIFLGSWRSTLIITVSIPLAILFSVTMLSVVGETINVMTLGGLALAVGILVDDATVTIENINYHLESGKEVQTAILDGARQIVVPATVSLLCICIVFVPMFSLGGVAGYLFRPLAEAVVFAMIGSYVLSRTLVPTLANFLLRKHEHHSGPQKPPGFFGRFQRGFEARFERFRGGYVGLLELALAHPAARHHRVLRRRPAVFRPGAVPGPELLPPRWTATRSSCTCAPRPAPGSRTSPPCAAASSRRYATMSSRPPISIPSWTISACRSAA